MAQRLKFLPLVLAAMPAFAQPVPTPLPPPITAPKDRHFPGEIGLRVDATDVDRHIFRMYETIPVLPHENLTLVLSKWLPGNHAPTGPIPLLAGLVITAGGQELNWQRDPVNMYAFHVDVPDGTATIKVAYEYLSPLDSKQGRITITPDMLDVSWRPETLFPAGYYQRDISVRASVTLPAGWQYATALTTLVSANGRVDFAPVPLDVLLDSPLFAGHYVSRIDLDPNGAVPVHMNIFADKPQDLRVSPEDLQAHRNLVQQAYRNFDSHHYDHYDFLLSLSGQMGEIGLEHQRSSEDGTIEEYFTDPSKSAAGRDLLPHEYTHSWNGKFRRPADLWSPDEVTVPERDSLLWVYEGQTDYWGQVLAARSGILKPAQIRDLWAMTAASLDAGTPGRTWRNLQDVTNDPIIAWARPTQWSSWSRFYDYYPEGVFIWLDADTLIREKTGGAKSLSDFARLFFGVDNGKWVTETYTFDDLLHALNEILPYDWAGFFHARLQGKSPHAPLDGLTRGGWKLVYATEESALLKGVEAQRKIAVFTYSLGLTLGQDGAITEVLWDSPAFKVGLAPGVKLLAVNGLAADSPSVLSDAITAAATNTSPIVLLVRNGNRYREVSIDYHGGLRYPHLERISGTPDRVDDVLQPLK
jgi:predicted metalloprotease with PDZ domain